MTRRLRHFERLQNTTLPRRNAGARLSVTPNHPLCGAFIEVIKDPVSGTMHLWHDFDYDGIDNVRRDDARDRVAGAEAGECAGGAGRERSSPAKPP